ncbi:uncharacterized protein LOC126811698 [Patella vulgata]|uniref:uncharacterized protein LOC126811698 n=1 Tax=Patella vulgata TaxID=6465 RepID=UPI00217FCE34|nr:uncharacterized protein LOC126811698 [Patella vulgata]XP_050393489.1 uncharacterized protein LOC126811698 [Patella vulgata]XP_050393490.1 uncharacterized protein LOC126811698 [Patella vulgata]
MASTKQFISDGEVLAQAKNRHEETLLGVRLQSLRLKEVMHEDCLAKQKERLIELRKQSLRTSGSSPNPRMYGDPIPSVQTNVYQKPWAYTFSETTHNAVYKELAQLPRKLPQRRKPGIVPRSLAHSAPASNIRRGETPIQTKNRPKSGWVTHSGIKNSNVTSDAEGENGVQIRPQSCYLPRYSGNHYSGATKPLDSNSVRFCPTTERPQTCQNIRFGVPDKYIDNNRKQKVESDPIVNIRSDEINVPDNDEIDYTKNLIGNPRKMARYVYHHRSKEESPYVCYKGRKLFNYIKPQERYKKDPLDLMRREKLVMKLSMTSSESLEESRKSALKAREAFPKAARIRLLNHLIENNANNKSKRPCLDYNAQLQARINGFLKSIDEYCETSTMPSAMSTANK